tara:strand:+ start:43 stop:234 length:192 start_codon:yes stop_codon:yes gene_type:complete
MNHQELENRIRSTKRRIKTLEKYIDEHKWDISQLKEHLEGLQWDMKNQINDLRFCEEKLKEVI